VASIAAVARILIVGGGCRGTRLARTLLERGHAVRISSRSEQRRAAIEQSGAEFWPGDPNRLATMRAALERVSVLCWMLGTAAAPAQELAELHSTRLEFFLTQAIDTTVRGLVYEAGGAPGELLRDGERRAREVAQRNAIPLAVLDADPGEQRRWQRQALGAIELLLGGA
jgi:hypothetical protein